MKLFETVYLQPDGIITERSFPLTGDGRKIKFEFQDNQYSGRDLFVCIDGKLSSKPFQNGSRMTTPINGIERLLPGPHTSTVIIVDKGSVNLGDMRPQIPDISIQVGEYTVTVKFCAHLSASIQCRDSGLLASCYHTNGLRDPVGEVRKTLESQFAQTAARILCESIEDGSLTAATASSMVIKLNETVRQEAIRKTMQVYPWLYISSDNSGLAVENLESVLEPINQAARDKDEKRKLLFQLLLDLIGRPALTPELAGLIQRYLDTKVEITEEEVLRFGEGMKKLAWTIPPEKLERMIRSELGIKEPENGRYLA